MLAGVEARERVITHTIDFPLDGALVFGAGADLVSGGSTLNIPVGLSLGRRVAPSPRRARRCASCRTCSRRWRSSWATGLRRFGFGIGADLRRSRVLDARIAGGLGDDPLRGVSIGAVWVH